MSIHIYHHKMFFRVCHLAKLVLKLKFFCQVSMLGWNFLENFSRYYLSKSDNINRCRRGNVLLTVNKMYVTMIVDRKREKRLCLYLELASYTECEFKFSLWSRKQDLHMCTVAALRVWHLGSPELPLALSTHRFRVSWEDDCVCSSPISWSPRLNVAFLLPCLWLRQPALILNIRTPQEDNGSLVLWAPCLLRREPRRGRSRLKETQRVGNVVLWGMEGRTWEGMEDGGGKPE